jgi:RNA polymerase sigma factor (sigma-70 family)
MEDAALLHAYARDGDQTAFAELVRRHVDLVHTAALRRVGGDSHQARDVTQHVFIDLAKKADALTRHPALPAWLHRSTRFAAANLRREAHRRHAREQAAAREAETLRTPSAPAADWTQIAPALDAALDILGEADRQTIVLRYFVQQPFADIAARLGTTEAAAQMRARLAATETDRDSTRDQLAALRRPMTMDVISSTLSATVQPGETIVTGGSLMPDGKRLFAFATPEHSIDKGRPTVDVNARFVALPDAATTLLGLDKLATSAANTLQHGEVWAPGEMNAALAKLDKTSGADTLSAPRVRLLSGNEGTISIGQEGGETLEMKVLPKLAADGRALDMEMRLELAPPTPPPAPGQATP